MTDTAPRFTVLAVNDKRDYCECCGKNGLQRVVWILDNETGEEKHFGTSCAMKPAKGFKLDVEIKSAVRNHNEALKAAWGRAARAYRAEGGKYSNGRDASGSPIQTPTDAARWAELSAIEVAKIAA